MERESIKPGRRRCRTQFALRDAAGRWESREGSPGVTIFRDRKHWGRSYCVKFSYGPGAVFYCPVFFFCGKRYFDLFGFIRLVYDTENDALHLSGYGDYYRAEDQP